MTNSSPSSCLTPPSVLILTKDEEVNIQSCLEHLTFSDDIVVLDSYSSDRTLEIARQFPNVRIIQRRFDNWSKHSNWALENIAFKYPWVYYSDADEWVTDELRDEIIQIINDPATTDVAFRLRYKNMFMDRWLKHGGIYPVWIMRLFRPDCVRYEEREVNAHPLVRGTIGELREHFIHYSFNKGLLPWFHKHNSYSQMESHEAVRVRREPITPIFRQILTGNSFERRRAMKNLSFLIPWRAQARFVVMYFIKHGMLDGFPGLTYAMMISMYEYWIEVKVKEQTEQWQERTKARAGRLLPDGGGNNPLKPITGVPDAPISIFILTLNEENNIKRCIDSARPAGDVVVLDSFSSDRTVEYAREMGARVYQRKFDDWSSHQNWALNNIPFKHPWVFYLDADECMTPRLRDEIKQIVTDDGGPHAAYFCKRRNWFMGKWISWAVLQGYVMRFFRPDKVRFDRLVNPVPVISGTHGYLDNSLDHYSFSKGIREWFDRHNEYSRLEAIEGVKVRNNGWKQWGMLFVKDSAKRKKAIKNISFMFPLRHVLRYIYHYLIRMGVLDGLPGRQYCLMISMYEYWTSLKITEIEQKWETRSKQVVEHKLAVK